MEVKSYMYRGVDYTRHAGFFNPQEQGRCPVVIVGAGAVGSFVALTLAKIGFTNITVWDHDKIDSNNIPNQFYPLDSIGRDKVEVLVEEVMRYTGVGIVGNAVAWEEETDVPPGSIVISAVDNMKVRDLVYQSCLRAGFENILGFIDPRMAGLTYRVYSCVGEQAMGYQGCWYSDALAVQERCTEKSVIFNVCGIASVVCSQAVKIARREPVEFEVLGDFKYHTHMCSPVEISV